jgi:hypothetical protein
MQKKGKFSAGEKCGLEGFVQVILAKVFVPDILNSHRGNYRGSGNPS